MARLTQILAGTAVVAGSTLFAAPAFAGAGSTPSVSAQPELSYTVKGTTANFVIKLTGTQHQATSPRDGSLIADPGPSGFSADFGDGGGTAGDAPIMRCSNDTKAPVNFQFPYSHTYSKPGTYQVTLDFQYCGDANNSHVKKTFNVVIPPAATTPAPAAGKPWMQTGLRYSVKGNTLSYQYNDKGAQHLMTDGTKPWANPESTGYEVDFGDGQSSGGNGGAGFWCTKKGLAPFSDQGGTWWTHTYKKPGTYTVKVRGYYCGDVVNSDGDSIATATYTIKVGANGTVTPTQTAPSANVTSPSKNAPVAPSAPVTKSGSAQTPAAPSTPAQSTPKTGPKVVTDHVGQPSDAENNAVLYGGSAAVVAGLAGGAYALRRRTHS